MTDNDEPPDETREDLEALQTTVDAIGEENLKEMLVDGLMGLQSGEIEPMDMTVEGPPDESEYYLDRSELTGEYHAISRDATRAMLDESSCEVAEVRLLATQDLLNDQAAVQRLCEWPGVTCDEEALN